jgi:hypothetical protein
MPLMRQRQHAAHEPADQRQEHRLEHERDKIENGPKPSTSSVAISRVREPTAAYMVFMRAEHRAHAMIAVMKTPSR